MSQPPEARLELEYGTRYVIGSGPDADIRIREPSVEPRHAELFRVSASHYLVRDLGSEAGTRVRREQVYLARLHHNENLQIGQYRATPSELARLRTAPTSDPVRRHRIFQLDPEHEYTIGASPDCDISMESAAVGWTHARIRFVRDAWILMPVGRGRPVVMTEGHAVRIGSRYLTMEDRNLLHERPLDDSRLDVRALTVQSGRRSLLHETTFAVESGQVVGIMGPSGAGKSVLLKAISGVMSASGGQVCLFGVDVADQPSLRTEALAYVPQDELVLPELTVFENVRLAARTKMPRDWPSHEISEQVERWLHRLGLAEVRDTRGDTVSGGQRKRVQLAMELITDPAFLVADEPTSGLSAWDSQNVVEVLREFADEGRIVLFTVHSPDIELLERLDRLMILDRGGQLAYYGPAHPNAMQYFAGRPISNSDSPKLIFDELERRRSRDDPQSERMISPVEWRERFEQSHLYRTYVLDGVAETGAGQEAEQLEALPAKRLGALFQGWVLLWRRLLRQVRDRMDLALIATSGPLIALMMAWAFLPEGLDMDKMAFDQQTEKTGLAFLLVLASVWFGTARGIGELPTAWPIFMHERLSGRGPLTHILPRFLVLAGGVVVQVAMLVAAFSLLFVILPSQGAQLEAGLGLWGPLTVVLGLTAVASMALAMLAGSVFRSRVAAVAFLPLILVLQSLHSGYFPNYRSMEAPVRTTASIFPSRWGFEAAVITMQSTFSEVQLSKDFLRDIPEADLMCAAKTLLGEDDPGTDCDTSELTEEQFIKAIELEGLLTRATTSVLKADEIDGFTQLEEVLTPGIRSFRQVNLGPSLNALGGLTLAFVTGAVGVTFYRSRSR